jgi:hypothetical protein
MTALDEHERGHQHESHHQDWYCLSAVMLDPGNPERQSPEP